MKRWSTFDALTLAALGLAAAVTAGVYDRLPRRLATHFDAHGVANGFMPKATGAWLPLGIAAFVWLSLRVGPLVFPARIRERMNDSPLAVAAFLLTLCLVGVHLLVLHTALAHRGTLPGVAGALFGALWVALALVMPRIRRNPVLGIRTPWTLSSDENWARTHRFGGYAFAAGGLLAVAASLSGAFALSIGAIVVSGLVPAVYSFVLFRRAPH
jgi:uncharacterized membrane protein